jgi:two-component system sensor histidine kinase/response regulator
MIFTGKRAVARQRERAGQTERILSAAGEAIYGLDRDGMVTFANPAALRLTGHDAGDLAGRSLHATVHHTKLDGTPNPFADCPASMSLEDGTIHSGAGDVYWRKDGTSFPVEVSATPMLDGGRVTGAVVVAKNITERLEAERASEEVTSILGHQRSQLSEIQSLAMLGSWEWDVATDTIDWSDELCRIFGVEPGHDPAGFADYLERVHPEDRARVEAAIQEAYHAGGRFSIKHRLVRPDGPTRVLQGHGHVVMGEDRQPVKMVGTGQDITKGELMEEELRRSGRYFQLSRDLVCTAGFDGRFTQLNAAWTETLGWTEAELRASPILEFVHPDDREETRRLAANLGSGGVAVDFVNRYRTRQGEWRWLEWNAIGAPEEQVIYASARDVTERKCVEAALAASERHTRQILETAHDAFVAIDADGLITDWNPQAQALFGWSHAEVLGCELAATLLPVSHRDAHRRGMAHFLATGEGPVLGKLLQLPALHRDGREFPIELTISAVETGHGYSFNAFVRDITQRRHAQEELELARDDALEASRMKSMFVANVSHEIRTPMNGVIGMTELLLDTDLDDEQREYGDTISSSGEALLQIIDDILDFSKIEAGMLELDPTDFDLRETIERACGMLAARAHAKGLELVVAIDAEVPARVRSDAARLRQVIANLVSNAIKFTAAGEVIVRASARPVSGDPAHDDVDHDGLARVRVTVSDTGIGIRREALAQLFMPFSQADGSTTRKYGGTGLGLAISRQLIELMGGEVGGESEPGTGSSFWFELTLPRLSATDVPIVNRSEIAGLKVLVVDDNAINRRILQQQLRFWQMNCEVAENAGDALALLGSAAGSGVPYALALLDQNMPGVDGHQLAVAIRAQPALRGMRLLLLTSSVGPSGGLGGGLLDGLLTKPVRQGRLYEAIRAAMTGDRPAVRRLPRPADGGDGGGGGPADSRPLILVVEDNLVNQAVAGRMLAKNGYRTRSAENGLAALEALIDPSFSAILMDCQMPELDGYETTREIRRREEDGRRIPIIAMTANSMQGERERCLAAGMDDYLTKPLRNRTLKDALRRWIPDADPGDAGPEPAVSADGAADGPPAVGEVLDEAVIGELEAVDAALLPSLLSLYFDEDEANMAELRGAVDRGDVLAVLRTAHKLKGASAAIGAVRVHAVASRLESTARDGDLTGGPDLLDILRRGLDETRTAFAGRAAPPDR